MTKHIDHHNTPDYAEFKIWLTFAACMTALLLVTVLTHLGR